MVGFIFLTDFTFSYSTYTNNLVRCNYFAFITTAVIKVRMVRLLMFSFASMGKMGF
jgi:hypothetical protein